MKTLFSTIVSLVLFFVFWYVLAFLLYNFAFNGLIRAGGEGIFVQFLKNNTTLIGAPLMAAYYAPKVSYNFIGGESINTMLVAFASVLSTVFLGIGVFAFFFSRMGMSFETTEYVVFILQYAAVMIGSFAAKGDLKSVPSDPLGEPA